MIAKIDKTDNFLGPAIYNNKKVEAGEAKILSYQEVNISDEEHPNTYTIKEDFAFYADKNSRTDKKYLHISLNPNPQDNISDELLSALAEEYLDKLGYGQQPYIVYKHEDIDRHHLHIITTNIDANGKKIDDSFDKRRSQKITQELEDKYKLVKYSMKGEKLPPQRIDPGKNISKQMKNIIYHLSNNYQYKTIGELSAVLAIYGIEARTIQAEKTTLKKTTGIVFSALDPEGKPSNTPKIKASKLGKEYTYKALISKAHTPSKEIQDKTKNTILKIKQDSNSFSEFQSQLKKKGIDVIVRYNTQNKPQGITFCDHINKAVFNGSSLSKELSIHNFHIEQYKSPTMPPSAIIPHQEENQNQNQKTAEKLSQTKDSMESLAPKEIPYREDYNRRHEAINNIINNLEPLFVGSAPDTDYNPEANEILPGLPYEVKKKRKRNLRNPKK